MADNGHVALCTAVPPPDRSPCPYRPQPGTDRCWYHARAVTSLDTSRWCTWTGSRGKQCYAYVLPDRVVCSKHRREPGLPPAQLLARQRVLASLTPGAMAVLLNALVAKEDVTWRRIAHVGALEGICRS
jgi:hypothetical protein